MKTRITMLALCLLILLGGSGCALLDSGPEMVKQSLTVAAGTAQSLVAKLDPTAITAGANGSIDNPKFVIEGFAGTGVYYTLSMQMIGGKASFNAAGAGGAKDVDPAVTAIFDTVRKSMSKAEWQKLLEALTPGGGAAKVPNDQSPPPEVPDEEVSSGKSGVRVRADVLDKPLRSRVT